MEPSDDDILAFRDAYWAYKSEVLEPTEAAMRALFGRWKGHHYWLRHHNQGHVPGVTIPSPVQRTEFRIKRLESVENKIRRHPDDFQDGWSPTSFRKMNDALGGRIVVYFLSDFTLIHNELHSLEDDLEICSDPRTTTYHPGPAASLFLLGCGTFFVINTQFEIDFACIWGFKMLMLSI